MEIMFYFTQRKIKKKQILKGIIVICSEVVNSHRCIFFSLFNFFYYLKFRKPLLFLIEFKFASFSIIFLSIILSMNWNGVLMEK